MVRRPGEGHRKPLDAEGTGLVVLERSEHLLAEIIMAFTLIYLLAYKLVN